MSDPSKVKQSTQFMEDVIGVRAQSFPPSDPLVYIQIHMRTTMSLLIILGMKNKTLIMGVKTQTVNIRNTFILIVPGSGRV